MKDVNGNILPTPKEKAHQLIGSFIGLVERKDFFGDNVELKNAKACAVICVKEVLKNTVEYVYGQGEKHHSLEYEYLNQVIEEIINYA